MAPNRPPLAPAAKAEAPLRAPPAWLRAVPAARRGPPAAPTQLLNFGAPPSSWGKLRGAGPGRASDEVKRLRGAQQPAQARALAWAALQVHPRDAYLWAQLLQLCRDALPQVDALRLRMVADGVELDATLDNALLDAAGRAGDVSRARAFADAAYDDGRTLSAFAYNGLIDACAAAQGAEQALAVLDEMWDAEVAPNGMTTSRLLAACARHGDLTRLTRIVDALVEGTLPGDLPAYNAAAAAARDLDKPELVLRVFAAAEAAGLTPGVALHNLVIAAHGQRGELGLAERAYARMLDAALRPESATFLARLGAYARVQDAKGARALLDEMGTSGCAPDARHYSVVLQALGEAGDVSGLREIAATMRVCRVPTDAKALAILLGAFGRADAVDDAWDAFGRAVADGVRVNDVVLNVLVDNLWRARRGALGEQLLAQARRRRWVGGAQAYTLLVDLFSRTGRHARVPDVFAAMAEARVVAPVATYTAVIAAAAQLYDLETVRHALHALVAAGHAVDERVVIAVCHAHHLAGRRDRRHYAEGVALLRAQQLPTAAFPDMADLLRKARQTEEARTYCDRALAAFAADDDRYHHAWMVRIYCAPSGDAAARAELAKPPFGPQSAQWVRYLCATVFRNALAQPRAEVAQALEEAQQGSRNEGSEEDIAQALRALQKSAAAHNAQQAWFGRAGALG